MNDLIGFLGSEGVRAFLKTLEKHGIMHQHYERDSVIFDRTEVSRLEFHKWIEEASRGYSA